MVMAFTTPPRPLNDALIWRAPTHTHVSRELLGARGVGLQHAPRRRLQRPWRRLPPRVLLSSIRVGQRTGSLGRLNQSPSPQRYLVTSESGNRGNLISDQGGIDQPWELESVTKEGVTNRGNFNE